MSLPEAEPLIDALEVAARRLVVVATGGGSRAISCLVGTPGASSVVLEGLVPYARQAIDGLLGGPQESYCSERTARRLAMAAWQRALALGAETPAAVGAAVTAGLRTRQPRRGSHRVHVAVQSLSATCVASLVLEKGARSRTEEEDIAATLLLAAVAAGEQARVDVPAGMLRPGEQVVAEWVQAAAGWQRLAAGVQTLVPAAGPVDAAPEPGGLVFPGSFDPLHEGHLLMARIAEEVAERPVAYELSITNVDKPSLDYFEIRDRAAQFARAEVGSAPVDAPQGGRSTSRPLWLTRAATFLEKIELFPESTFVMGADTFVRLADPRYYRGSREAARDAARTIAARTRGLIVFGRVRDGVFKDASQLDVPAELRDVAYFVSEREFRLDISSTVLRTHSLVGSEA